MITSDLYLPLLKKKIELEALNLKSNFYSAFEPSSLKIIVN